ncbi:MAG: MFS transporter [Limnochordaceae bacterium]|nr:MFS transporter [Limnochordaceae bacterium]
MVRRDPVRPHRAAGSAVRRGAVEHRRGARLRSRRWNGHRFFEPARQSSLIHLVDPGELSQANAVSMLTRQIAQLVGPTAAGLVVARWGIASALWFHAASYGVSALAVASMRWRSEPGLTTPGRWPGAIDDLKAGLRMIGAHPLLRIVFALAVVVNFAMAPVPVVLPLYVATVTHQGPVGLGLVQGTMGMGMLAGSLLMSAVGGRWAKGPTGIGGLWTMASSMLLAGWSRTPLGAGLAFAAWGAAGPLVNVPVVTLVQQQVPPERQGQAFAAFMAATVAAQPVGMLLAGLVGDRWGAPAVFLAVSLLLAAVSLAATAARPLRFAR